MGRVEDADSAADRVHAFQTNSCLRPHPDSGAADPDSVGLPARPGAIFQYSSGVHGRYEQDGVLLASNRADDVDCRLQPEPEERDRADRPLLRRAEGARGDPFGTRRASSGFGDLANPLAGALEDLLSNLRDRSVTDRISPVQIPPDDSTGDGQRFIERQGVTCFRSSRPALAVPIRYIYLGYY